MNIETRLRNGADEARRVAAGFERPDVMTARSGAARRLVTVAAAGFAVLAIVMAGIWGRALIIHEDEETVDQPSPDLEWHQVEVPPEVDSIQDMWTDDGTFYIWSGTEIWSSDDGEQWEFAVETPSDIGLFGGASLARFDGTWIALTESASAVYRYDGADWISEPLDIDAPTDNPLLTARAQTFAISKQLNTLVITGTLYLGPDPDRVMNEYAPELAAGGAIAEYDPNNLDVEIRDSGGSPLRSIPAEEIDPRLTDYPYVFHTAVWLSRDGSNWDAAMLEEDTSPVALEGTGKGFVLVTSSLDHFSSHVWWSEDGATWEPYAEYAALEVTMTTEFHDMLIARRLGDELVQVSPGEDPVVLTTFPELGPGLSLGAINAGDFGILADAYDTSTAAVPVVTMFYSPDAERWTSYELVDVFGAVGTTYTAVGKGRLVVAFDPGGEAYSSITAPFELWVATRP